jgi:sulfur carrier protein ThiS
MAQGTDERSGIKISFMMGSSEWHDRTVQATTVGALKTEVEAPTGASVNVNTNVVHDSYELKDGDLVAIVSSDKKGGK